MFHLVTLTAQEARDSAYVGLTRHTESRRKGTEDGSNSEVGQRLSDDMLGAQAEYAFCKWRGCEWEAHVNTYHSVPDVAPFFEVRAIRNPGHSLIVRPNDAPDRLYVLLCGDGNAFYVRGWLGGAEARQDQWWRNPHNKKPAWFVPQSFLYDPGCLKL